MLSSKRSSRRWGSCTWCWWMRLRRRGSQTSRGSAKWDRLGPSLCAASTESCHRYFGCFVWRGSKRAKFDGSMALMLHRWYQSRWLATAWSLKWLRWSQGHACSERLQFKLLLLTFNRDDQLRNNGQHLGSTLLKHVENALHREETIGLLLFANTFEEDW